MFAPLIGFVLTVLLLLAIAFVMSYLFWTDRYKTPEVIAAEVMHFSEQVTGVMSVVGVGAIVFVVISALINFSIQIH
ncbi:hypothetical protein V2H45_16505 [Tumidithrix elongata RA019]|uniref:Uncharacterized protein n=1 Tax=Tumidithrix elongata BACA0141 TaxID=2716417 RepID=A0AAW9Q573_9CYAN|nr:hypothetical protein [Tumidithrix elongata RA019]